MSRNSGDNTDIDIDYAPLTYKNVLDETQHEGSDKNIDATVSMLVSNILKKTKEKEKERNGESFPLLTSRNQRHERLMAFKNFPFRRNSSYNKRKKIAEYFPAVSQNISFNGSSVQKDTANEANEKVIIVKREPVSDDETATQKSHVDENDQLLKVPNISEENGFHSQQEILSDDSNGDETEKTSAEDNSFCYVYDSVDGVENTKENEDDNLTYHSNFKMGSQTCNTEEHQFETLVDSVKGDDGLDLPFVEDYYHINSMPEDNNTIKKEPSKKIKASFKTEVPGLLLNLKLSGKQLSTFYVLYQEC